MILTLLLLTQHVHSAVSEFQCKPGCESQIYCQGDLLKEVQLAEIYEYSKTFVDLKLLADENTVISKYKQLKADNGQGQLTKQQLKTFLDEYFAKEELETCELTDFIENPTILDYIVDENYKKWAKDVIYIWKELSGKMPADLEKHPDRHSYINLPHCFIKAGGIFTEIYYWDSLWIIRGLLLSDMFQTAKGMVENFFHLVNTLGYVPNGSRIYYYGRSQPALLTRMVENYHQATNDEIFLRQSLEILEKELNWWIENRMVQFQKNGKNYNMVRYNVEICEPRPEAYLKDYNLGEQIEDLRDRQKLFSSLRSCAESGWDFSTREMREGYRTEKEYSLLNVDVENFIFVDLNSIIQYNARRLGEWYEYFGNTRKAIAYKKFADDLLQAIEEVLYDEKVGVWFDWDTVLEIPRQAFYPSNLSPLWTGSFIKEKICSRKILQYLIDEEIISQDLQPLYYGIPTSKKNSTQQWDYFSSWAPLQSMLIEGLRSLNDEKCELVALSLSKIWLKTNYEGFQETGHMYEKYSGIELGRSAGKGNYSAQVGFGWTNGFVLHLLRIYGGLVASKDFEHFTPKRLS